MTVFLSAFVLFQAADNRALALQLDGDFVQGGLVFGKVAPGSTVRVGEKNVRVSEEGLFILGFGRDHGPAARLTVTDASGAPSRHKLEIAKRDYKIQRIDGLPKKMVSPPDEVWERIKKENRQIARARANDRSGIDFLSGFQWPTIGVITGVYGSQRVLNGQPKRPHFGIDIAAPTGTSVVAPAGGVVTLAETDHYYTGGTIILDHGHGLSSAFLHMHSLAVSLGDEVEQGDPLGTVGSTGRSTGPHLDWRINWFKERLDPALLAGPMPPLN